MTRLFCIAPLLACLAAAPLSLAAQSSDGSPATSPAGQTNKPGVPQPSGANPFPEDTNAIPVLPTRSSDLQGNPGGSDAGSAYWRAAVPVADYDPVRSPDDALPASSSSQGEGWSSSQSEIDNALPASALDTSEPEKKKKRGRPEKVKTQQEVAAHNIRVGSYYLDTGDWKGALSRFESALVLDPENPDVYWGLAEAEYHLGQYANARAHFEKQLLYDPDGKHARDARKALKEPVLANVQSAVPAGNPAPGPQ